MTLRSIFVSMIAVAACSSVSAHDPRLHEQDAKAKPTTCEQYDDRDNYSNDLSDPDIKALKEKCESGDEKSDKDD